MTYLNKTYPKFKDLDPVFSSAGDMVKMDIFSQPLFLSKISKPERFSGAQVRLLIQKQVKCKGTIKLCRVYVLDSEMVSGCRRCLERKMALTFQLMFTIVPLNKTDNSLGNP